MSNYIRNEINLKNTINGIINDFENNNQNNQFPTTLDVVHYLNSKNYMNYHDHVLVHDDLTDDSHLISNYLNLNKERVFTIETISNLLFHEHGIIEHATTTPSSFEKNTVLSSYTLSNYVHDNFINQNKITDNFDTTTTNKDNSLPTVLAVKNYLSNNDYLTFDNYTMGINEDYAAEIQNIVDTISLVTWVETSLIEQSDTTNLKSESNVLSSYATSNLVTDKKDELLSYIDHLYFTRETNLARTDLDDSFLETFSNGLLDNNPDKLIDAFAFSKIMNKYYHIANTEADTLDKTPIYNPNLPNIGPNEEYIPTIKFLKDYASNLIYNAFTNDLATGNVIFDFNNFVAENMTVNQTMKLLLNNTDRLEVIANKEFITIDDDGFVQFKKVDTLTGHASNIVRAEDEYSIVTGNMITTFNDNQFICGQYNDSNNIYKVIDYTQSKNNNALFVVGCGEEDSITNNHNRKNGFEVHDTGEVFVRSNLILGENWRISFDNDSLSIEKYESGIYITKHIFT